MNTNKILLAGLVGGIVAFFAGWIIYGMLLAGFFESNAGSATGVSKGENVIMWALGVGNLLWGFLLAIIYGRWASISTFSSGAMSGAIIGFLAAGSIDFILYGTTNIMNLTATIVDPIAFAAVSALAGGAVGAMLGRGK